MEPTLKGKVFDFREDTQARQYSENVEAMMRYISMNYKQFTAELVRLVEVLQLDMPEPVNDPTEGASAIEVERWKMAYKKQAGQNEVYRNFLAGLFHLLLGQCTEILKDKLQARAEYEEINQTQDGIRLLALIKQLTFTYNDNRRYEIEARNDFKAVYFTLKKEQHQSVADFYRVFRAHMSACSKIGVNLYDKAMLQEVAAANSRDVPNDHDRATAQDKAAAMRFIRACRNVNYEAHLKNKFLDGENAFPTTLADARAIMEQRTEHGTRAAPDDLGTGLAFITGGRNARGDRTCFRAAQQSTWWQTVPTPNQRTVR